MKADILQAMKRSGRSNVEISAIQGKSGCPSPMQDIEYISGRIHAFFSAFISSDISPVDLKN